MHRNLSRSHPMFRLMAPHFLFLLAINHHAISKLLGPGRWVDTCMQVQSCGLLELAAQSFATWRFDCNFTLPNDLKFRGVDDKKRLPNYPYRDDALDLYNVIRDFVKAVVHIVYKRETDVVSDWEIQHWRREMELPIEEGGCGFIGVPGENGFKTREELIDTITPIIFQSSVGHASTNFPQYDEYGFPPNYPSILMGDYPKHKEHRSAKDIVRTLPGKSVILDIMVITKILSTRATAPLGKYEVEYTYDPIITDELKKFRTKLQGLTRKFYERNRSRKYKYPYLNPNEIPNAISV